MIAYKIETKGGLLLQLNTRKVKPSQRCPSCGKVDKNWADLSNRYHICSSCDFEIERDKGSVLIMYNVATNQQQGCGTHLLDSGCLSSTSRASKRKHTGEDEATWADEASKIPTKHREVGNCLKMYRHSCLYLYRTLRFKFAYFLVSIRLGSAV